MNGFDGFTPLTDAEREKVQSIIGGAVGGSEVSDTLIVMPCPDRDPARQIFRHGQHGEPVRVWFYRDTQGAPLAAAARYNVMNPGSPRGKAVLPWTYGRRVWVDWEGKQQDRIQWHCKAPPLPRPLYGLDQLAAQPERSVLVCEGEKAAEAADALLDGYICITSMGGSNAANKSDWTPLTGRNVAVWPDNDEAGAKYANSVATLAREAGAVSVRIVDVGADFPEGWDLADDTPEGITFAILQQMVDQARYISVELEADEPRGPEYCDDSLALSFTAKFADRLRYVALWGKWFEWTGKVWRADETNHVIDLSRDVCRDAAIRCHNQPRVAAAVASAKTIASVERLARADRRHVATVEQWDADQWLLNCPDGVIDLTTGQRREHRPGDYMTKCTAVSPSGECPQWLAFLDRATGGDKDLRNYLQRVAGYCLTGSIREHALFFCFGTGANGKGVMINTITGILADYATIASMETFTATSSDRHPTDLAMLRGARLVTAQETEEGRRWAEAKIKAMTGGDPISARFMRQDFFTFEPVFKFVIAGNHRPGIRNIDEAIRRRFNLIPFGVKIPPAERDLELPHKLRAEWPGILAWMIDGCLQWQRIGLAPPEAVKAATAEYLSAEDALATWLGECCKTDKTLQTTCADLFASWRTWAERAGEEAGSLKRFSQALQTRGFESRKVNHGHKAFSGIGLNARDRNQENDHAALWDDAPPF